MSLRRTLSRALIVFNLCAIGASHAESFNNPFHIPIPSNPTTVGTADFNGDGRPDFFYGNGLYYSTQESVILALPGGGYSAPLTVTLPFESGTCLAADMNHDGFADLVCPTTSGAAANSIAVLLCNGDGTFQSARTFNLGGVLAPYAHELVVASAGDLNGDGKMDVVVLDYENWNVYGVLGDGAGGFSTVHVSSMPGNPPSELGAVSLFDINGDGKPDLVFANYLTVWLGGGDGTFTDPLVYGSNVLTGCAYADIDGDGKPDAICYKPAPGIDNVTTANLVAVHGNGDGSFAKAVLYSQSLPFYDFVSVIAVRDINGDGIPDIIAESEDGLVVLLGQPALSFAAPVHYAFYNVGGFDRDQGDARLIADFNGDGYPDIAMPGANGVYIAYGRPDGTFIAPPIVESGTDIGFAGVADFNGDGIPDVLTTGGAAIELNLGKGDGTFVAATSIAYPPNMYSTPTSVAAKLIVGDFNGDGHTDFITTANPSPNSPQAYLYLGTGTGSFANPVAVSGFSFNTYSLPDPIVADLNGDGKQDIVAWAGSLSRLTAFLSNGNGSFTALATPLPYQYNVAAVGDFDHDGIPDMVAASSSGLLFLKGKGDGSFSPSAASISMPLLSPLGNFVPAMVSGDFDGDGNPDFALLATSGALAGGDDQGPTQIFVFYGNGDGTFQPAIASQALDHGYLNLGAADLNQDGLLDFVLSTSSAYGAEDDYTGTAISIVHMLPGRAFSPETNLIAGDGLSTQVISDFNGDGLSDLLFANGEYSGNSLANSFVILLNQGNIGVATSITTLTCAPNPATVGQSASFSISVASPNGTPTGTVRLTDAGIALSTLSLANGGAQYTGTLSAGTHPIRATYAPSGSFGASSASCTEVVNLLPTTSGLAANPTASAFGSPVVLTAAVAPASPPGVGTPTGNVTFLAGGAAIGTGTLASGIATLTTSTLPAGTDNLTCTYSGDSNYAQSTCGAMAVVVAPPPPVISLTSSLNPALVAAPVTFTVHLTNVPAGTAINLYIGSSILLQLPTDANGDAAYTTGFSTSGSYPITAAYWARSRPFGTTATLTEVVNAVPILTTLSASPNPAYLGQTVNLTAAVNLQTSPAVTSGTVVFEDGSTPLGTVPVTANGAAVLAINTLTVGTHTLTAQYFDNTNTLVSTSPGILETILALPSTFTLTLSPSSIAIPPGAQGTAAIQLASLGSFSGPVSLTYSSLPATISASITPAAITLTPGGTASSTLVLTLSAQAANAIPARPGQRRAPLVLAAATLLLLPLGTVGGTLRRRHRRLLGILLAAMLLQTLTGCTTIGYWVNSTYQVDITATDANPHTQTAPLTVVISR
jgi:hypothetical protein